MPCYPSPCSHNHERPWVADLPPPPTIPGMFIDQICGCPPTRLICRTVPSHRHERETWSDRQVRRIRGSELKGATHSSQSRSGCPALGTGVTCIGFLEFCLVLPWQKGSGHPWRWEEAGKKAESSWKRSSFSLARSKLNLASLNLETQTTRNKWLFQYGN